MFADIIVDISHEKLDRTFQYRIPEKMEGRIQPGTVVRVPFGKGRDPLIPRRLRVGAHGVVPVTLPRRPVTQIWDLHRDAAPKDRAVGEEPGQKHIQRFIDADDVRIPAPAYFFTKWCMA